LKEFDITATSKSPGVNARLPLVTSEAVPELALLLSAVTIAPDRKLYSAMPNEMFVFAAVLPVVDTVMFNVPPVVTTDQKICEI